VRLGEASAQINDVAGQSCADLIAIATRGLTGLKHAFLGSTTQRVVRAASCPVLVVRENEHFSAKERARRERRFNFKKFSCRSISPSARASGWTTRSVSPASFARACFCYSVMVHSYALSDEYTVVEVPNVLSQQQEYAEEEMTRLRRKFGKQLRNIKTKVVVGPPVEQIDQRVRAEGIDLIITSTHGRSGVKRASIGSTAEQIVRHAPCPVLVVPNRTASKRPASRK
jgi:nucleotide-binding universal stress UspA family protein